MTVRVDIQALRGLAVMQVILFHASHGLVMAGYLGVDIFFVVSGFLITGMIASRIESGNFSFADFYFRRAKRLLPAAYITFIATAIASLFLLDIPAAIWWNGRPTRPSRSRPCGERSNKSGLWESGSWSSLRPPVPLSISHTVWSGGQAAAELSLTAWRTATYRWQTIAPQRPRCWIFSIDSKSKLTSTSFLSMTFCVQRMNASPLWKASCSIATRATFPTRALDS